MLNKGLMVQILFVLFIALTTNIARSQASSPAQADSPIKIVAEPIFVGEHAPLGPTPLKITISNSGRELIGEFSVVSGSIPTKSILQLPQGSTKEFVIYVLGSNQFNSVVKMSLKTGIGEFVGETDIQSNSELRSSYLIIGSSMGDSKFLKANEFAGVSYCTPENAPVRSRAYVSFKGVLLSPGSELLNSDQVEALKGYVARGGTVLTRGSSAQPILQNAGISSLFNLKPLPAFEYSMPAVGNAPSQKVSVYPYSSDFQKFDSRQPLKPIISNIGMGQSVYYPIDIDQGRVKESEIENWKNYYQSGFASARPATFFQNSFFEGSFDRRGVLETSEEGYQAGSDASAFSIKPPAAQNIMAVIFGFILVVGPISFFVLKKLGKGELAWYTGPAIAVVASFLMFSMTSSIYTKNEQAKGKVNIVLPTNSEVGYAESKYKFFFPKAGQYLFSNGQPVESIRVPNWRGDNPFDRGATSPLSIFDSPDSLVPAIESGNLGFHDIQASGKYKGIRVDLTKNSSGGYQFIATGLDQISTVVVTLDGFSELGLKASAGRFSISRAELAKLKKQSGEKYEQSKRPVTLIAKIKGTAEKLKPEINGKKIDQGSLDVTVFAYGDVK